MAKLTVRDLNVNGKRVLLRVDYNVPLEEQGGQMVIRDDTRIVATLPTLRLLIQQGGRLILAAHLGRPRGKRDASLSLRPVAARLAELLGCPVNFAEDCVGEAVEQMANALPPGGVLLLENVRFHRGEEDNDPTFAEALGRLADVYVNDAFGAAHRAHASTEGVARLVAKRGGPCAAGLLMERELKFLGEELEDPARPFVVILGGAKVSDKIKVVDRLLEKADSILIGGAMANTFKLAQGLNIGKSLVEGDMVGVARAALEKAGACGRCFLLPTDEVVATPVDSGRLNQKGQPVIEMRDPRLCAALDIADTEAGVDIGPATVAAYGEIIRKARTILWNGPMGIFEDPRFAEGTIAIARAVAEATQEHGAKTIIGGGDSVRALHQAKLGDKVTFMSTGGGASLEFLEGAGLPGVAALADK